MPPKVKLIQRAEEKAPKFSKQKYKEEERRADITDLLNFYPLLSEDRKQFIIDLELDISDSSITSILDDIVKSVTLLTDENGLFDIDLATDLYYKEPNKKGERRRRSFEDVLWELPQMIPFEETYTKDSRREFEREKGVPMAHPCSKCGSNEWYTRDIQFRSGDEETTEVTECACCKPRY